MGYKKSYNEREIHLDCLLCMVYKGKVILHENNL